MNRYAQRLSRVARALGCPIHGERLSCPACEVPDPLPEPLTSRAGDFIKAILARVGQEALRDICLRVLPPNHGPCPRCGAPRQCLSCQVQYTKTVFRAIPLTAEEQHALEALLATCRRLDRERRSREQL
jgi:hypothetical protein